MALKLILVTFLLVTSTVDVFINMALSVLPGTTVYVPLSISVNIYVPSSLVVVVEMIEVRVVSVDLNKFSVIPLIGFPPEMITPLILNLLLIPVVPEVVSVPEVIPVPEVVSIGSVMRGLLIVYLHSIFEGMHNPVNMVWLFS